MISAALLARVSSDKGGRSASVPEQLDEGRKASAELGWPITAEFSDEDISASRFGNGKTRPGWQALRDAIADGTINAVILWATNRASREMHDWTGFLNLCRDHRVQIYVITHDRVYRATNARDRKSLLEDGVDAEHDSEKISEGVRRGVSGALAAGRPLASKPYGYTKTRDPGNGKVTGLAVDPVKAQTVTRIFTQLDAGHTIARTARDAGMDRHTAYGIAKNLAYIAKRRLADGTLVNCQWQPIIEEPLYWRVQEILASHHGAGQPPSTWRSLLAQLATCGKCGDWVTTEPRQGVRRYRCKKGCFLITDMEAVDDLVAWVAIESLCEPGVLERHLPDDGSAAAARAEAAALRAELDDWAAADISARAYQIREAKLLPQIAAADQRAKDLAVPVALRAFAGVQDEADRMAAAMAIWETMPVAAARDVIRAIAEVRIYPRKMRENQVHIKLL